MVETEQPTVSEEQVSDETPPAENVVEEDVDEAEEEALHLAFPNARVVKIIRENLKNPHQIKKDVKITANKLMGEILRDISKTMDAEPYNTLSIEHFNKASRKYREIALSQKRVHRIKKVLEKQRAELDEIITEIELETPSASSTL
ncbi:NFYB/HAP3 family transcription factor subunit [Candidatus Micrarchaeota archaeon]|nr:NFYB/HAP3 family transcription factor subunit [Candidatus Micrarchaeota archaeon]